MVLFLKSYVRYIQKEQINGPENYHAMRKSPGHFSWVRALGLLLCKEDDQSMYKIESANESENCFLTIGSNVYMFSLPLFQSSWVLFGTVFSELNRPLLILPLIFLQHSTCN
jgi:hypothetical protein